MRISFILCLCLICGSAWASDTLTIPDNGVYGFQNQRPMFLTISCGKGTVSVNTNDGSVVFDNCTPDEAGKRFWEAVRLMFPESCRDGVTGGGGPALKQ